MESLTTTDLLDRFKNSLTPCSDYHVAKYLGITHQTVSKWRGGKQMSFKYALQIADELKLDVPFVYMSLLIERAKTDRERQILKSFLSE
ncbi:hypothetical protein [Celerinatantimonas sp. MCCC 1A17872]|uniref:hypothetical protein n=1 Tax=Celerinatantimonas sp. MCCC 1A17872 TaxID=3177514 RepID=UPI0038C6F60D